MTDTSVAGRFKLVRDIKGINRQLNFATVRGGTPAARTLLPYYGIILPSLAGSSIILKCILLGT